MNGTAQHKHSHSQTQLNAHNAHDVHNIQIIHNTEIEYGLDKMSQHIEVYDTIWYDKVVLITTHLPVNVQQMGGQVLAQQRVYRTVHITVKCLSRT